MALYPDDPRVADAHRIITSLKAVEALGNFRIAEYYEKQKKWDGALVYYNEGPVFGSRFAPGQSGAATH